MINFNPEPTDPEQIRSEPISNEGLSPEVLDQIGVIYAVIGRYVTKSREQFENGFQQDANPAVKVGQWSSIAVAWINYHEQHLASVVLPKEVEQRLISALFAIANGVEDVDSLDVPADVGEKLLTCYDEAVS